MAIFSKQPWVGSIALFLASTMCVVGPSAAGTNMNNAEGIAAVGVYAGTWHTAIAYLDTPYSTARKETRTLTNDCWHSAEFFVCRQSVDGKSEALLVFFYNAKDRSYSTYPVAAGADAVQRAKLTIEGNVWTYPWQQTEKGKTTYFRVVNIFTSQDTIEFRQEYSLDQLHWERMAAGHEHRVRQAESLSGATVHAWSFAPG